MKATITFLGKLNDHLAKRYQNQTFEYSFSGTPTVKHLVEALHVPHPEVGVVYINHQFSCLNEMVKDGDYLEVHPIQYTDTSFTQAPRFVLDNHLGKLALYLRMIGLDTQYRNDFQDGELAWLAVAEKRILVTRDRQLLMLRSIEQGYWVRNLEPDQQVVEIINHFQLRKWIKQFRRCLRCNEIRLPVDKNDILARLEPKTKLYFEEFKICPRCDQIYWRGSHYEHMLKFLDRIINEH